LAEDSDISCCDFAADDGCGAGVDCSACPGANVCGYLNGWIPARRHITSYGGTPTQLNDKARLRPREMGYQQDYGFWMHAYPDDCNRAYVIMGVCAPDGTCDNCCGTPTLRLFYHNGGQCVEMTFHPYNGAICLHPPSPPSPPPSPPPPPPPSPPSPPPSPSPFPPMSQGDAGAAGFTSAHAAHHPRNWCTNGGYANCGKLGHRFFPCEPDPDFAQTPTTNNKCILVSGTHPVLRMTTSVTNNKGNMYWNVYDRSSERKGDKFPHFKSTNAGTASNFGEVFINDWWVRKPQTDYTYNACIDAVVADTSHSVADPYQTCLRNLETTINKKTMVPFIRGVYGDLRTTQGEFNVNRVSANPTPPTSALQSKLGCANWCEKHLRRTLFFNYPKAMEYIRGGPLRDANWDANGDEYGGAAGTTGYHPDGATAAGSNEDAYSWVHGDGSYSAGTTPTPNDGITKEDAGISYQCIFNDGTFASSTPDPAQQMCTLYWRFDHRRFVGNAGWQHYDAKSDPDYPNAVDDSQACGAGGAGTTNPYTHDCEELRDGVPFVKNVGGNAVFDQNLPSTEPGTGFAITNWLLPTVSRRPSDSATDRGGAPSTYLTNKCRFDSEGVNADDTASGRYCHKSTSTWGAQIPPNEVRALWLQWQNLAGQQCRPTDIWYGERTQALCDATDFCDLVDPNNEAAGTSCGANPRTEKYNNFVRRILHKSDDTADTNAFWLDECYPCFDPDYYGECANPSGWVGADTWARWFWDGATCPAGVCVPSDPNPQPTGCRCDQFKNDYCYGTSRLDFDNPDHFQHHHPCTTCGWAEDFYMPDCSTERYQSLGLYPLADSWHESCAWYHCLPPWDNDPNHLAPYNNPNCQSTRMAFSMTAAGNVETTEEAVLVDSVAFALQEPVQMIEVTLEAGSVVVNVTSYGKPTEAKFARATALLASPEAASAAFNLTIESINTMPTLTDACNETIDEICDDWGNADWLDRESEYCERFAFEHRTTHTSTAVPTRKDAYTPLQ